MLCLKEEKHLIFFDRDRQYFASYTFEVRKLPQKDERGDFNAKESHLRTQSIAKFTLQFMISHRYQFEWNSHHYDLEIASQPRSSHEHYGRCPLSLETYLQMYQQPKLQTFLLTLKPDLSEVQPQLVYGQQVGKLIIKTQFVSNPFSLPVNIQEGPLVNIESIKKVKTVLINEPHQSIVCCGTHIDTQYYQEVNNFKLDEGQKKENGFKIITYEVGERVESRHICVLKGQFYSKQLIFDKAVIRILSLGEQIFFMPTLMQILQVLKSLMGEVEPLTIIQNVETDIEDCHRLVFYADLSSFYSRVFRSYLYDKIKDYWLIQGMIHYNRSNKNFQDIIRQLIEQITEGEELVPLQQDTFYFDEVWKLKARFFYHVLSNFKTLRDYGSSSLANLIIDESRKGKISSQLLFKRLKNKYGLKNFRTNYEQQFVKSTGLNRIFYELIDLKRQNKVKIIVRQKALANKVFRLYNMFRIKLEQQFELISPLTERIINKNKFLDSLNKKKQLSGALAVPKILKCLPYFRGSVAVETDASDMAFQLELKEENIIEQKQNVTTKIRAPTRKLGEGERFSDGYSWIMIDTAHVFPAVYKNQNVYESTILEKIKKRYDSEQEEIKVLNCISSRDHSSNQKICRALLEKVKTNPNLKENCTINVKRKILQILPIFFSKATDFMLWEDYLGFLKLYEPVCYDHSEEGYYFLLSLVESAGQIEYKRQFQYYFQNMHRIMLAILRDIKCKSQDKEQKLRMQIFHSLMQWKSKYSFQILRMVKQHLLLSEKRVQANLEILKVIFKNILPYIKSLNIPIYDSLLVSIQKLMSEITAKDKSFELFAIKLEFELKQKESELSHLDFLKHSFKLIENYREDNTKKYGKALNSFKNILNKNKKAYGLQLQLNCQENQSYFIAQYLWTQMCSRHSNDHHFIRLQWIKIYRIFYFYYIPIITLHKIKNSHISMQFPSLTESDARNFMIGFKDFTPDIKWFSGYDSRSAKELKAKYEMMNENKRKKKFEEYSFQENNIITNFVKQHPGRENWDQLGRQALRIFISIYGAKEQNSDGAETERYKSIQEGFKKIEQKLKRGRMPELFNYDFLKEEINMLMNEYNQVQQKVTDILEMVDKTLLEIAQQKGRRQQQLRDQTRVVINLDSIQEQEDEHEQAGERDQNDGAQEDEEYMFAEDQQNDGDFFADDHNEKINPNVKVENDEDLLFVQE